MDFVTFLSGFTTTALLVAGAAWLIRKLVGQWLDKDLDKFKADIRRDGEKELESLRARLQLESQLRVIEFGSLHSKRAEVIAELYEKLSAVQRGVAMLPFQLQLRAYQQEYGTHDQYGLTTAEQISVDKLSAAWRDFSDYYDVRKIYFSAPVVKQLETFLTLSGVVSSNYHNIAFTDENGASLVDESVKAMWDAAIKTLPSVLAALEGEFREILGSK
ncbi:hypothetical protein [Polaromonas sp.]|uniref:hypothetical protein n=1 Tax=Polaromonas sp. TaxID=1869339 RepID=UPI003CBBDCFA